MRSLSVADRNVSAGSAKWQACSYCLIRKSDSPGVLETLAYGDPSKHSEEQSTACAIEFIQCLERVSGKVIPLTRKETSTMINAYLSSTN